MYEIILGEIIACVCVMYGLYSANKYLLSAKIIKETEKLQLEARKLQAKINYTSGERQADVSSGIENMGIDGIIDALGIPAMFKPFAKGAIDNILKNPEKLKELAAKFGVDLDGMSSEKTKGPYL
ncbi:MAG: hypothetical protein IMZ61_02955 [Planctomycetes bacterium]|nr:hypothetical protein [Planctomycetota bacterium]